LLKQTKLRNKRDIEKELVRKQIKVEQDKRQEILQLKETELLLAKEQIQKWANRMEISNKIEKENDNFKDINVKMIEIDQESDSDIDEEEIRMKIREKNAPQPQAPPRNSMTEHVTLKFSSRGNIPTNTARETEDGIDVLR
jgi:hypothetical protein